MKYTAPKGTKDILPSEIGLWKKIENTAAEVCSQFGFEEIRTPEFEFTDLFVRGVGDGSDIVKKEMYTFARNDKDSFTLKPEGTSPVMRSYIQNGMASTPQPVKLFYITSCYRAENPQKGRMRQFHQLGCEIIGSSSAYADSEVITLADTFIRKMGVSGVKLFINSVGCPTCRAAYYEKLREYISGVSDKLCDDCLSRMQNNPMRVLDCKKDSCKKALENAPLMQDYLCDDCREHFENVQKALTASGVSFELDAHIVRGLDYYTNTAFEFVAESGLGAQSTLCGGGRYDGLCEQLGGEHAPGVGFGLGIERLALMIDAEIESEETTDIYIAPLGEEASLEAMRLRTALIDAGLSVSVDLMGRSLKAQMKYADKISAAYVLMIGEEELKNGIYVMRNMQTKEQCEIKSGNIAEICEKVEGAK